MPAVNGSHNGRLERRVTVCNVALIQPLVVSRGKLHRHLVNHIDKILSGCDAQILEQALHVLTKCFIMFINLAPGFRFPAVLEFAGAGQ